MLKIIIDPGHGGTDPGAVGNGLLEKVLTLKISFKIRDLLLQFEGVQVKMSREDDRTLSLKQRTDMANAWGADFLLSVHINAGGGTGYEDFRHNSQSTSSESGKAQAAIHHAVMDAIEDFKVFDRGIKAANFHMVRESKMPAVLTENLFIDRDTDAALLKNEAFLNAIAQGHVNGIVKQYKLKSKGPTVPQWDGMELKQTQIGRLTILKPINLWKEDADGKLQMVRIMQPNERYRVYGYRSDYGGQYDVGDDHWVTKMNGFIRYETPSKFLLNQAKEYYE